MSDPVSKTTKGICATAWGVDREECDRNPCECADTAMELKRLRAEFEEWKERVRTHIEGY